MQKEKILVVHNYYQIPGGEDTVVANEKKLLEEHGHKVVMYTRHNNEIKNMTLVQKIWLPFCTIFNFRTYKEVKKIIKEQNIDIVHVHNTLNIISPAVYYAARKCKTPVVQTIHNFRLLCPGATFYRDGHICEDCVEKGLLCAVMHKCYRESRLQTLLCVISTKIHRMLGIYGKINYICLTEFNKNKILKLKKVKNYRVFVKPNYVESERVVIPYGQREDFFIYVGRLDKLKGIDILFETWKTMKENSPQLLVAGTGPMEEWCRDYIKVNKLQNITMLGFVHNAEVKELIGKAKGLVLPTRWYEGFPMTIAEAFSMGTPVLGSNIGNVGGILSEIDKTLCFVVDDKESIRECIKNMKVDAEYIHMFYESNYSSTNNYNELIRIYNSIE